MSISKIRYKGFEWEHNPESLSVIHSDNINEQKLFSGKSVLRKLSAKCRVIKGRGKLSGYDCLEQFNRLLKLQSEPSSGILTLPEEKPFYAYFKKLELICEPVDNEVTYSFEFIEDSVRNTVIKEKYFHTVSDGETLWDISYIYGVDIDTLVELNPEIMRVDELTAGSRVRIC